MASLEDLTPNQLLELAREQQKKTQLIDPLLNDPETRTEVLRLLKKKSPHVPIPELDARTAMEKQLEDERKAREELEAKVRDQDIRTRIKEERERVKREYQLSDADMGEVEKLMVDEKAPIPHWDAAAKVFKASKVQATPTPVALEAPIYEMPSKDIWARGIGNKAQLDRIAMKQATEALNDIVSGRIKVS